MVACLDDRVTYLAWVDEESILVIRETFRYNAIYKAFLVLGPVFYFTSL